MQSQALTNDRTTAWKYVEDAGRNTCLERQLSNTNCSEWGEVGRLVHHGAAHSKCRCNLPRRQRQREVPRSHHRNNSDRLTGNQCEVVLAHGRDFIEFFVCHLGIPAIGIDQSTQFDAPGIGNGLAHFNAEHHRQLGAVLLHQRNPGEHEFLALLGRHARPRTFVKCSAGCADCHLKFIGRCIRNLSDSGTITRGDQSNIGIITSSLWLAVDDHGLWPRDGLGVVGPFLD